MGNDMIRIKTKTPLLLLILVLVMMILIFGLWVIFAHYKQNIYFDLGFGFSYGLIMISAGIIFFLVVILRNKLEYNSEGIRYLNYKNQVIVEIKYSDIKYYNYTKHGSQWQTLNLYTDNNQIKIGTIASGGFIETNNVLIEKKIPFEPNIKTSKQAFSVQFKHTDFMLIAWLIFVVFNIIGGVLIKYKREIDRNEKVEIKLPLIESQFNRYRRSKDGFYWMSLINKEYTFCFQSPRIDKLDRVPVNDSIDVQISKRDYQTKITKQVEPGFFDKHFRWDDIDVSGIKYKGEIIFQK